MLLSLTKYSLFEIFIINNKELYSGLEKFPPKPTTHLNTIFLVPLKHWGET